MYSYVKMIGQGEDSFLELVIKDMETDVFENDVSVDRVIVVTMMNFVVGTSFVEEERNPLGISSLNPESDEGILMLLAGVYIGRIKLLFEH